MSFLPKGNSDCDPSQTRCYRRSTKPKSGEVVPKYPRPPRAARPAHDTYVPDFQAYTIPLSFYDCRPRSYRRSTYSSFSALQSSRSSTHYEHSTSSSSANCAKIPEVPITDEDQCSGISPLLVKTVNSLGRDILSHAFSDITPKETVGLCAMSIFRCLSMVAVGSKDTTFSAFFEVLRFKGLDTLIDDSVALESYGKSSSKVDLSCAAALFIDKDVVIEKPWWNLMSKTFGAQVRTLAADPINAFLLAESRGRFTDVFREAGLAGSVLALVTCLYFKGKWAYPFQLHQTRNSTFFGFGGRKRQACQMMSKRCRMEYVEDGTVQMVVSQYQSSEQGPKWKAAVILPKDESPQAMMDVLSSFSSPEVLRKFLLSSSQRGRKLVHFLLPRFSLKLNLDLTPALMDLGLAPAFSLSNDFSAISEDGPLAISHVSHDLFLEVNEDGAETIAATNPVMVQGRTVQPRCEEVRVDRPFLFIVFDATTGLILCQVVVCEVGPGAWR